ncbi:uncharacterized protein LOC142171857 [Nicotiana tabacum]|uniref:Uncharacterized protein LOC142171857 n=1 Tax=Nicotiana tabacum TaxID=4097 RepID=A0AC58T348_TOBAC
MRRFNPKWFVDYHGWLEYSISNDAAYCLSCYLFKDDNIHQGGGDVFSSIGFRSWNKKKSFDKHVGGTSSFHNQAKRKCVDQGFTFRGHDESKTSFNKGNFLKILSWYAKECDKIYDYVLEYAPQNDEMTSPMIQKDIVTACKMETVKAIIKELNGDYFFLLVNESFDVSRKEQMAIVLRYVDRMGFVVERLVDIVHVKDTCASSLKKAIIDLIAKYSLSLSYVRGKCYDGASNMQGELNGLKMLIRQESRSAHSIHCFSHQLQ